MLVLVKEQLRERVLLSSKLLVYVSAPVLAYMLMRLALVGHFGLVAFGSQNLAGITTQFLDEPLAAEFEGETRELAFGILKQRQTLYAEQPELGQGALSYQAMEQRWDPLVWKVVVPFVNGKYGTSMLENHRRISSLNTAILKRRFEFYIVWIAKAVRQSVRILVSHIVVHPPFLALIWPRQLICCLATNFEATRLLAFYEPRCIPNRLGCQCSTLDWQ